MVILIVGCGKLGRSIAVELDRAGHEISIIDKNYKNFNTLPEGFKGKRINGDALEKDVVMRARVEEAETIILTSRTDQNNLVQARMFNNFFGKKNLIALNTEPEFRLFYDKLNVRVISMVSWGTLKIEEMLIHQAAKGPEAGEIAYTVMLPEGSKQWKAEDLAAVSGCLVFATTQAGITKKISSETRVGAGDFLHLSATTAGLQNLYEKLEISTKAGNA